jgi:ferredoxin-NADP reductase
VRDLGDHSRRVARLRPGTRVLVEGPYGAFTQERRTRTKVLLVAAGIGITPIRALAEELAQTSRTRPGDITLLYRGNDEASMVLARELELIAAGTGMRVELLVGPPVPGSWLPPDLAADDEAADAEVLRQLVPGVRQHDVYVCGPPAWMGLVRRSMRLAGVPSARIHDERFGW